MRRLKSLSTRVRVGALAAAIVVGGTALAQQRESSSAVRTETISVNGVTLHYVERGQGVPVVFVHGTLGDYRTWDGQMEPFSETYRAISYSRRYQYPNDLPQDVSTRGAAVHATDLAAFIQALNLGRVHLVGHSGGGFVALLLARDHPDLLLSLTLGEPAGGPLQALLAGTPEGKVLLEEFRTTTTVPSREAIERGDAEEAVRAFISGVMGAADGFGNLPPKFQAAMMENAEAFRRFRLTPAPTASFSCDDARRVGMPTLLLHGEVTPEMFVQIVDILENCLPRSERKTIAGASHSLQMENPGAFNETVLAFLARQ